MQIQYVVHRFGPNETIHGIIRKHNAYNVSKDVLAEMMELYNYLNDSKLPHPGDEVKIPIYRGK